MTEPLIVCDPGVMFGKPVVAGTRITVELINDGTHLHPAALELAFHHAGAERFRPHPAEPGDDGGHRASGGAGAGSPPYRASRVIALVGAEGRQTKGR